MNSSMDINPSTIEIGDDGSSSIDNDTFEDNHNQPSETHQARSSVSSISGNSTTTNNGSKRQKDVSPCYVCGAKAHGYNFDQITCESCKAFFRRNALKSMDKFRCRNNDNCAITSTTRKRCKRCRLRKCFKVGMRKEWILTDEEKRLKQRKIERNRLIKQQAQSVIHPQHQNNDIVHSNFQPNIEHSPSSNSQRQLSTNPSESCFPSPSLMCMHRPSDQQMYDRHHCLLKQLSNGYQELTRRYPQPHKFVDRNTLISQTINMDSKLILVKDLTRELTQMTTSRLLHYFTLIPEFQLLVEVEQKSILIKNMLAVFMFHGALTYNEDNDTFVDRTTMDQPYDAKYLLFVYGPRVYSDFITLARSLTSLTYQSPRDKQSDERAHTLFLLLMIILLFSDGFDSGFEIVSNERRQQQSIENESTMNRSLSSTSESASSSSLSSTTSTSSSSVASPQKLGEKLHKIQQIYIDIACRYLHDEFGLTVGRRMFQNLLPLLFDLQKLCSTLANVNLCELAEDEDRLSSSRTITTTTTPSIISINSDPQSSSPQFNSTMISGTSHLNELQKENRAPPPPPSNSISLSPTGRSSLTNNGIPSSSPLLFQIQ